LMKEQYVLEVKTLRIPREVVEFCDLSEESSIIFGSLGEDSILMFIPSNPRDMETDGILEKCDWKSQPQKPINYEGNLFIMVPKELLNRYNPENKKLEFVIATLDRVGILIHP